MIQRKTKGSDDKMFQLTPKQVALNLNVCVG